MPVPFRPARTSEPLPPSGLHLGLVVLLPFVLGYYLSYLFRTINAAIAGRLMTDLGLDASQLGLLTSTYFLAAALAQLPLGIAIDRYGPGRVQGLSLFVAALGAYLFSVRTDLAGLALARGLIGLGVASALMSGLKAIVWWFPKDRVALLNGCFIATGATGALTAAAPTEWILRWLTWPELFQLLAVATAGVGLMILVIVPSPPSLSGVNSAPFAIGLRAIFTNAYFWRLAPVSSLTIGSAWALQSLWAAPYLADVAQLGQAAIVQHLVAMAGALCVGGLSFGVLLDRLARRKIGPSVPLSMAALAMVTAELVLALQLPIPPVLAWCVIGAVGSATVLSYTTTAAYFPKESIGRANTSLNVFHFGGAWLVQCVFGSVVDLWPRDAGGHYPVTGFAVGFVVLAALQILALFWFLRSDRRAAAAAVSS